MNMNVLHEYVNAAPQDEGVVKTVVNGTKQIGRDVGDLANAGVNKAREKVEDGMEKVRDYNDRQKDIQREKKRLSPEEQRKADEARERNTRLSVAAAGAAIGAAAMHSRDKKKYEAQMQDITAKYRNKLRRRGIGEAYVPVDEMEAVIESLVAGASLDEAAEAFHWSNNDRTEANGLFSLVKGKNDAERKHIMRLYDRAPGSTGDKIKYVRQQLNQKTISADASNDDNLREVNEDGTYVDRLFDALDEARVYAPNGPNDPFPYKNTNTKAEVARNHQRRAKVKPTGKSTPKPAPAKPSAPAPAQGPSTPAPQKPAATPAPVSTPSAPSCSGVSDNKKRVVGLAKKRVAMAAGVTAASVAANVVGKKIKEAREAKEIENDRKAAEKQNEDDKVSTKLKKLAERTKRDPKTKDDEDEESKPTNEATEGNKSIKDQFLEGYRQGKADGEAKAEELISKARAKLNGTKDEDKSDDDEDEKRESTNEDSTTPLENVHIEARAREIENGETDRSTVDESWDGSIAIASDKTNAPSMTDTESVHEAVNFHRATNATLDYLDESLRKSYHDVKDRAKQLQDRMKEHNRENAKDTETNIDKQESAEKKSEVKTIEPGAANESVIHTVVELRALRESGYEFPTPESKEATE